MKLRGSVPSGAVTTDTASRPRRELPPWLTRVGRLLTAIELSIGVAALLLIFGLVLLAPMLAEWAIRFGPAEYFALMVFAFAAVSSLSGGSLVRGLAATALGLLT